MSDLQPTTDTYRRDKAGVLRWAVGVLGTIALSLSAYCWGLLQGHESRLIRLEALREVTEAQRERDLSETRDRLRRIEDMVLRLSQDVSRVVAREDQARVNSLR